MPNYYVAKINSPNAQLLFEVNDDVLFLVQPTGRTGLLKRKTKNPISLIQQEAKSFWGAASEPAVEEVELKIGIYHPSIARPTFQNPKEVFNPQFESEINEARRVERELGILVRELEACFDVVSPEMENLNVYGFIFEKIIHLACIGVESLFYKVLRDNKIDQEKYSFRDFAKLEKHMQISGYSASLPKYPWIPAIMPFEAWSSNSPARALSWNSANNKLKHARGENIKLATMRNAIDSVCAYMILSYAIFGDKIYRSSWESVFSYFLVNRSPVWKMEELYFSADDRKWWAANIKL